MAWPALVSTLVDRSRHMYLSECNFTRIKLHIYICMQQCLHECSMNWHARGRDRLPPLRGRSKPQNEGL
jgi:hypothetical protein